MPRRYYLLKIRSSNKIPSYLQIRDERFTLKYYIRLDRKEKIFQQLGIHNEADQHRLEHLIDTTPYGKIIAFAFESEKT